MSMMPIVRSLRRVMLFVLLMASVIGVNGQAFGQKYSVTQVYGGSGTNLGQFNNPYSMVQDAAGNVIVADVFNHRIQKFNLDGTFISSFGSFGSGIGEFNQPHGLALDATGNLYVADRNNNRIQVFDSSGNYLRQWGSGGSGPGQFDNPRTIRIDKAAGIVFVADDWGRRLQQFTLDGTYIKEFGGYGTGPSQFQLLQGFQLDAMGNIWAVDRWAAEIRKFDRDGNLLQKFGSHGSGPGQFDYPSFIDIDSAGFLYVHEGVGDIPGHRNRIQKFNAKGKYISELTDLTTANQATFLPSELLVLANGDVLVADYADGNHRILRFKPEWPKYQYVKSFGAGEFGADSPAFMDVDADGNVYVADRWSYTVKVFDANGTKIRTINTGVICDFVKIRNGQLLVSGYWTQGLIFTLQGEFVKTVGFGLDDGDGVEIVDSVAYIAQRDSIYKFDLATNTSLGSLSLPNSLRIFQLRFLQNGNLFVSDPNKPNNSIFNINGELLWTLADSGISSLSDDGRMVIPIVSKQRIQVRDPYCQVVDEFDSPGGVCPTIAGDGTIYVMDYLSREIDVFKPVMTDLNAPSSVVTTSSSTTWSTADVTATITATDNLYGSGVKEIHYAINQGTEIVVTGSSASFTLTENGTHSIAYWAVDNVGNVETTKYATVRIDKVAPVTTLTRADGQLTLTAVDAHSGISKIKVQVNGGSVVDYNGPFADTVHTVKYWAEDVAGNVEASRTEIINPGVKAIAASQVRLPGGFGVIGTVTLDAPAPVGGTVVNLASSNIGVITVDATVTIPEGETSSTFDIDANPVSLDTSVSVSASLYETNQSVLLTILCPFPSSLVYTNAPVSGGTSTTGTITISGPAPVGGTVVSLASSSLSALVPTSVTIPAGQMTATFAVSTNLVSNDTSAVISATVYGVKVKSTLSILGPKVSAVTVASASIASTATTTGTVTLSTNAPVGGKVVTLSSSNTGVATVPVSVTVPAGSNTATFTITAGTVAANTSVTITAATNGSTGTATVTVTPPVAALSGITTNVAAVTGGVAVTGTVTLTRAAPTGGTVVTLASSSTTLGTVPASVTVAAGATTATFTITTKAVTAASTLTVTGTYLGVAKSASITVNPVRLVSTLTLNPTSVKGGTNSTGTVTLTGPATEAVVVTLTSGTTTVARVPTSVTVPAGATTATFTITTLTQTATRTSIITARTGTTSRTATLSVTR